MATQFNVTPSQKATVEKLKSELPHKNYALLGFVSEPVVGSRNMLVMREYGKDKVKIYESCIVGPRGVINARTVLPHVDQ